MNYTQYIIEVLCEAGNTGLSVRKIALHVYNSVNSFFAPADFDDVHRCVQAWLLRNSRQTDALVCRCTRRGYYRLNLASACARQMLLRFDENI